MPFNRILCFVWFLQPQRLFLDVYCQIKKNKYCFCETTWNGVKYRKWNICISNNTRERVYANVCIETIYLFFLRHFLHFSANYLKCSFCSFCLSCFYFQWNSGKQTRICEDQQCFIFIHRLLNYFLLYEIHVYLYLFEECLHLLKLNFTTDCITMRYLRVLRSDVCLLIRLFVSNLNSRNTIKYEIANYITERTFVHLIKVHQQSIFIMHLQTDVSKYIFDASSKPFNQRQYHPF